MENKTKILGSLLLLTLLTPQAIRSEEPVKSGDDKSALTRWAEGDYLLGTWGGVRTDLSKHGVDFEFFYLGSTPRNIQGGIKTGAEYQGALLMTLDLNSEKLVGYAGGNFHASSLWIHGHEHFSDEHIGDLNKVNLVDFPSKFRLWELWYSQKMFSDKLTIKLAKHNGHYVTEGLSIED